MPPRNSTASPEQRSLTTVLISPGGLADREMLALLMQSTGSLTVRINQPEQLTTLQRLAPAIIASNGLMALQPVPDSVYGQETGKGEVNHADTEASDCHMQYPSCDAERIAAQTGAAYVNLAPGQFATFWAMLKENAAFLTGRDYVIPTFCSPGTARRRISRAVRAAKTIVHG